MVSAGLTKIACTFDMDIKYQHRWRRSWTVPARSNENKKRRVMEKGKGYSMLHGWKRLGSQGRKDRDIWTTSRNWSRLRPKNTLIIPESIINLGAWSTWAWNFKPDFCNLPPHVTRPYTANGGGRAFAHFVAQITDRSWRFLNEEEQLMLVCWSGHLLPL